MYTLGKKSRLIKGNNLLDLGAALDFMTACGVIFVGNTLVQERVKVLKILRRIPIYLDLKLSKSEGCSEILCNFWSIKEVGYIDCDVSKSIVSAEGFSKKTYALCEEGCYKVLTTKTFAKHF